MLIGIAVLLLVLWLIGGFIVPVGSSLIHVLVVIAIIVILWNFLGNGRGRNL